MAKKEMMVCPTGPCGPRCIIFGILAAAFFAAGLWTIVTGVMMQTGPMAATMGRTFLWYLGGFVLWMVGKGFKGKACPMCSR